MHMKLMLFYSMPCLAKLLIVRRKWDMSDYVRKIHDLLALAESPNEHEARSALLKARKLMAKYKISENELADVKDRQVVKKLTEITCSMRRDPWVMSLAGVISDHHCCKSYNHRKKGGQTSKIGFIGFPEDVSMCEEIFIYAVNCVRSKTDKLRKSSGVKKADGYGYGFCCGLNEAYNRQQDKENWDLVMVIPEGVKSMVKDMGQYKPDHRAKLDNSDGFYYTKGCVDGRKFHDQKRLKDSDNRETG